MTQINFVSDLHLDISKDPVILPGGQVLVISGDSCEVNALKKIADFDALKQDGHIITNKERIMQFFINECSNKYEHVLMIAGNHEHYNFSFDKTIRHMRESLPDNFHVLDNDTFEIDNTLFIGATLWTDMNKNDPLTKQVVGNGMNDFSLIKRVVNDVYRGQFTVEQSISEHTRSLKYFKLVLDNPSNAGKNVVIISHHAPSSLSIDERYVGDFHMNGGFYSQLDEFILDHPQIKLWIHGHTHSKFDYMIGDTRVVCNPRGYQSGHWAEETGWDPNWTIEV